MIVTLVTVKVKKDNVRDFLYASLKNARESTREPGCKGFKVLQREGDPTSFLLYEAFESDEAIAAHKETGHYKAWRATVEPWMAKPRSAERYELVS